MSALRELNTGRREDGGEASDELFSPTHTQKEKRHALLSKPDFPTWRPQGFLKRPSWRRCQPWRLLLVFVNLRASCLPNDGYLSLQALSNRALELARFPFMNSFSIQAHIAASISASDTIFLPVVPTSSRTSGGMQRNSAESEGRLHHVVRGSEVHSTGCCVVRHAAHQESSPSTGFV